MPPNFPTMFMLSSLYRFCFLFAKFGLFSDLGQCWFWQYLYFLERAMATHSRVLAWRIPGTVEPGGLRSMRSHRVGHNWSNLAVAAAYVSMFLWRDEHLELLISLFFLIFSSVQSLSRVWLFTTPWSQHARLILLSLFSNHFICIFYWCVLVNFCCPIFIFISLFIFNTWLKLLTSITFFFFFFFYSI